MNTAYDYDQCRKLAAAVLATAIKDLKHKNNNIRISARLFLAGPDSGLWAEVADVDSRKLLKKYEVHNGSR